MAPKGNVIARNICWGGKWQDVDGKARPFVTFTDNLVDEDPHFVQKPGFSQKPGFLEGFKLREDSPAWKIGFKGIPVERIGLYESDDRASWPVLHTVRTKPPTPPPPPRPARKGPAPVFKVGRAAAPPQTGGEGDLAKAMVIAQGIYGEPVALKSYAWLSYDDQNLYVAIRNDVDPKKPIEMGGTWGGNDAVEVALRKMALVASNQWHTDMKAPIFALRGYPNGRFESADEAGAPAEAVRKAGEAVKFAAKVVDAGHWTAEYRIPFAALGLDPKKDVRLQLNISVRKTSGDAAWVMWQGTGGCTWEVEGAGILEIVP
jgi:hypothetical protein